MHRHEICLVPRNVTNLTIAIGHVTVRRSVKAITTNFMSPVELIRQSIQVSVLGKSLMKCGVEYGDLRQAVTEDFARRKNAFDVGRVVKRSKIDAVLDAPQHGIIDNY